MKRAVFCMFSVGGKLGGTPVGLVDTEGMRKKVEELGGIQTGATFAQNNFVPNVCFSFIFPEDKFNEEQINYVAELIEKYSKQAFKDETSFSFNISGKQ